MKELISEISKKVRGCIYWLTLLLSLILIESMLDINLHSITESNDVKESLERDLLLTSTRFRLENLKQKWECDCLYFDFARNSKYENKEGGLDKKDTLCYTLKEQIVNEKSDLIGTEMKVKENEEDSIPFFDLKFVSGLYPIILKTLVLYFFISILFSLIRLKNLIITIKDENSLIEITDQMKIENKINYPPLNFFLSIGLLLVCCPICLILFSGMTYETMYYIASDTVTKSSELRKFCFGIINIALLLSILITFTYLLPYMFNRTLKIPKQIKVKHYRKLYRGVINIITGDLRLPDNPK